VRRQTDKAKGSGRGLSRGALGIIAGALALALLVPVMGAGVASAQDPTPTPTGTAPPATEPSIALWNPSQTAEDSEPNINDACTNKDCLYHFVATTANEPPNTIVEVYIQSYTLAGVPLGPELTIGTMTPVLGDPGTYELYWDIPADFPEGDADITVRMFADTILGFEEVANNTVNVDMELRNEGASSGPTSDGESAARNSDFTYPTMGGPLGFFKPRGGAWRGITDQAISAAFDSFLYYTTSAKGEVPEWTQCAANANGISTSFGCGLAGKTVPSEVKGVMIVSTGCADPDEGQPNCTGLIFFVEEEASDVATIKPYLQIPEQMTIVPLPNITSVDAPKPGRQIAGNNRPVGSEFCMAFAGRIRDHLNRPVANANIDIELVGPNDQIAFGEEFSHDECIFGLNDCIDLPRVPDKGGHTKEPGRNCDPRNDPDRPESNEPDAPRTAGEQGEHNVPGGDDIKHGELTLGSTGGFPVYEFFSPVPGFMEVRMWIDDETLLDPSENRPADTDTREDDEPMTTRTVQWLTADETISIDPVGRSGPAGSCQQFIARARAGTDPVPNLNIDVHAIGPTDDLDFCDPPDATPRQAPDTEVPDHQAEDAGESSHKAGAPPHAQHTEGNTDTAGNFVFGVTSPVNGDTTLTAWIDNLPEGNNDVLDSGEPSAAASVSWSSGSGDTELSFITPSQYGGSGTPGAGNGTTLSTKQDKDELVHLVARADAPQAIAGVEFLVGPTGGPFQVIGQATQVQGTDTYEFFWPMELADGSYVLQARVVGTNIVEQITVTVNDATAMTDPPQNQQAETIEISQPANASQAAFNKGVTAVKGMASAGVDAVDLFYTKVASKDTPAAADWINCGSLVLPGGSAPQEFTANCTLKSPDQPHQVTGIAAISFDCHDPEACQPATNAQPSRGPGQKDSGDAHRVFGVDSQPRILLEPAEEAAEPGTCMRFTALVQEQSGQPIPDQNVDIHLTGPDDDAVFCDPADSDVNARRAPDQGGHTGGTGDHSSHQSDLAADTKHTETETNTSGRVIFGILSQTTGDSALDVWVDVNDNDEKEGNEPADTAVAHWETGTGGGCTISGTTGKDTLNGTDGDDVICGGKGDDRIRGGGGNDLIKGQRGDDILKGQEGDDELRGGRGKDSLDGGPGTDTCKGGGGKDTATPACETSQGLYAYKAWSYV
jgi:RTX calcium-binding nonapeptide repeat (4 copies)